MSATYAHRQLIGFLGLLLPLLVVVLAGLRPTEGLAQWELLDSVSAYYYTGAVAVFIGILIALAVYLFTYRGYKNRHHLHDRVAGIIAGGAAVLVASFPTDAPGKLPEPSWWTEQTWWIHHVSAIVLFAAFIFFSLFLFPKSNVPAGKRPPDKRWRNRIYIFCGLGMVGCMVWAAIASFSEPPTIFWPESLALELFAVSWLVKGRVDRTAANALYYGRRPGQLISDARSAIRESQRPAPPPEVV